MPEASPTSARPPTMSPPAPARRRFTSYLAWILGGALVRLVAYTSFMRWWSYGEGERAGVLQKFSKRGWVCKTYEGELAQYVVAGVAPQIWHFSIRDDAVAAELHKVVGKQVRLYYEEHPGLPTTCFGDTAYFVQRYELVEGSLPAAAPPGQH